KPNDLARLHVSLEAGADQIEGASLRRDNRRALADAERERADSIGIPDGKDALPREDHEGVTASHLEQSLRDRICNRRGLGPRHQMQDDLGIGRGGKESSRILELTPNLPGIDQVSVMRERERAAAGRENDRLSVD